jgi:two-component system phosphate regulon response regulator PhoB
MAKVLVVDDDHTVREVVVSYLRAHRHDVVEATDGEQALAAMRADPADLVVLDLMLPGIDGLEVCRRLRETGDVPVIMLTALGSETDRVLGLERGADDYVTKPFSVKVLLERIKALRRRRTSEGVSDEVTTKLGVTVDRRRHQAMNEVGSLALTRSEFRLLDTLIRQPGRVFHRTELIDAALGEDTMVMERTIDVHIRALRRKLGERADVIETVRGVGYRFRDSELVAELT